MAEHRRLDVAAERNPARSLNQALALIFRQADAERDGSLRCGIIRAGFFGMSDMAAPHNEGGVGRASDVSFKTCS